MTRAARQPDDRLRFVLDDETVDRLRAKAAERGVTVEDLLRDLVDEASRQVDELLGPPPPERPPTA